MDIGTRTPAELIDMLITVNLKCYNAQDIINDLSFDDPKRLKAAEEAQKLNNRRNQIIRKLDEVLGFGDLTQLEKSYKDKV